MGLFGKKSGEQRQAGKPPKFADHPVFTLTAGMSTDQVADRIGPATETKTALEATIELAGPGAIIDPAKVEPEEQWSYDDTPAGFYLSILFREERLVKVKVFKTGTNDLVARIDERGVADVKSYQLALRASYL